MGNCILIVKNSNKNQISFRIVVPKKIHYSKSAPAHIDINNGKNQDRDAQPLIGRHTRSARKRREAKPEDDRVVGLTGTPLEWDCYVGHARTHPDRDGA